MAEKFIWHDVFDISTGGSKLSLTLSSIVATTYEFCSSKVPIKGLVWGIASILQVLSILV